LGQFHIFKQGVALTGRNTTGPPRATPWQVTLHMRRVTDDRRRRQTPATVTSSSPLPYTMCRRASNNTISKKMAVTTVRCLLRFIGS